MGPMARAEGAGAGGAAGREPPRGGCGAVRANSRPLRASRGELPGEAGHGARRRGGDGMKRKPWTPRNGPLPFPALLCSWRAPDGGASNRSSARVRTLAGERAAPLPRFAGAGWAPRGRCALVPGLPLSPAGHRSVRGGAERSVFPVLFPGSAPAPHPPVLSALLQTFSWVLSASTLVKRPSNGRQMEKVKF